MTLIVKILRTRTASTIGRRARSSTRSSIDVDHLSPDDQAPVRTQIDPELIDNDLKEVTTDRDSDCLRPVDDRAFVNTGAFISIFAQIFAERLPVAPDVLTAT